MELLYGAKNKIELKNIKKALLSLNVVHISYEISSNSVDLIEAYSKSHGLTIPDALIASTTIIHDFELFTYNLKDFRFIKGLKLFSD